MPVPSADRTATLDAPAAVPTASFAPGGRAPGGGFDEELRRLLRSRLIFVHLIAMALIVLLAVMVFFIPGGKQDAPLSLTHGLPSLAGFVETLIGTLVLWRRPGMSLRSL
jgi:hypothetical protein